MAGAPAARRFALLLAAVALVALALRLATIVQAAGSDYNRFLVLDASTYHRIATHGDPNEPFWQPPAYPWLLRAVYALAGGPAPGAARVLQALLGALTAALTGVIVRRFATPRAALAAAAAVALYGPLIYFDNEILPASPATFLLTALLALVTWPPGGRGAWPRLRPVAAGLLLGVIALFVPVVAFAGAALAAWTWRREGFARAALFVAFAALPLVPVAARNMHYEPRLVPVSWNGGVNLWIGNNPDYPQSVGIRPGIRWTQLLEKPRCAGGTLYRADESAWFSGEVRRFALAHPLDFAGTWLRKAQQSLAAQEIGRNRDEYEGRAESVVVRLTMWPFGVPFVVLLPAAAIALAALVRARRVPWPLPLVAAGVLVTGVVFFPTARYRAPAIPALVALAAIGLPLARRRDALAGAAALAVSVIPHGVPPIPHSETLYEIAVDRDAAGATSEAIDFYRRALAGDPENADIHLALGLALGKQDRDNESREQLERAVALEPQADVGWQALGLDAARRGDRAKARRLLERAATVNPCNRHARASLANLLIDLGDYDAAAREIEAARQSYRRRDAGVERAAARLREVSGRGAPVPPAPSADPSGRSR